MIDWRENAVWGVIFGLYLLFYIAWVPWLAEMRRPENPPIHERTKWLDVESRFKMRSWIWIAGMGVYFIAWKLIAYPS